MIKIDKGIPMPSKAYKYPWEQMEVGDSFFANVPIRKIGSRLTRVRRKWPDRKWITRKEGTGSRVWRVE